MNEVYTSCSNATSIEPVCTSTEVPFGLGPYYDCNSGDLMRPPSIETCWFEGWMYRAQAQNVGPGWSGYHRACVLHTTTNFIIPPNPPYMHSITDVCENKCLKLFNLQNKPVNASTSRSSVPARGFLTLQQKHSSHAISWGEIVRLWFTNRVTMSDSPIICGFVMFRNP